MSIRVEQTLQCLRQKVSENCDSKGWCPPGSDTFFHFHTSGFHFMLVKPKSLVLPTSLPKSRLSHPASCQISLFMSHRHRHPQCYAYSYCTKLNPSPHYSAQPQCSSIIPCLNKAAASSIHPRHLVVILNSSLSLSCAYQLLSPIDFCHWSIPWICSLPFTYEVTYLPSLFCYCHFTVHHSRAKWRFPSSTDQVYSMPLVHAVRLPGLPFPSFG